MTAFAEELVIRPRQSNGRIRQFRDEADALMNDGKGLKAGGGPLRPQELRIL